MKTLLTQIKWQFTLLFRNNLIFISIAVTAIYAGLFYLLKGFSGSDGILTLLIYNDPAIIGLFFIGLLILMEKDQQVMSAFQVSPINFHVYMLARIIPLSIIGWACALGMAIAVFWMDFDAIHFSLGVFSTCLMFCLVGLFMLGNTSEFLLFLLRSIPVLILMSLPLINYYELADIQLLKFFPIEGPLQLILHSYGDKLSSAELMINYASTLVWIMILYGLVYRYLKPRLSL